MKAGDSSLLTGWVAPGSMTRKSQRRRRRGSLTRWLIECHKTSLIVSPCLKDRGTPWALFAAFEAPSSINCMSLLSAAVPTRWQRSPIASLCSRIRCRLETSPCSYRLRQWRPISGDGANIEEGRTRGARSGRRKWVEGNGGRPSRDPT